MYTQIWWCIHVQPLYIETHFKAAECYEYDVCSASHLYHCHGLKNEECQSKNKSTFLEWAEGQFDSYLQAGILCDLTNRWQENFVLLIQ
jgi:hypothetical protein